VIELGVPGHIMPPGHRATTLARRNEEDGFSSVWWPSHLMGWHPDSVWTEDLTPLAATQPNPHQYFDPLVMMGAAATHTERIRLGVVVTDLIAKHPAAVAQAALTVDHLSKGRTIVGVGSGERMNVTPYGMDFERPVARLAEGIEVMRLLWEAEGPVDHDGEFFPLRSAVLGLSPYGDTPPIWVAAHGPRMLRLTGRLGDGWLPTKIPVGEYARSREVILQAGREAGRDMEPFTPAMLGYVMLAPDEATLARLASEPLVRFLCMTLPPETFRELGVEPPLPEGGFHNLIPAAVPRAEALRIIDGIPPEVVRSYAFCGTPEQVVEQIRTYEAAGLRHLICWNITPFGDPDLAGWSFQALKEVKSLLEESR